MTCPWPPDTHRLGISWKGAFDALSLMAAGYPRVVAILPACTAGALEWVRGVREIVWAMDADLAGHEALAWSWLGLAMI